jgi:hypothetical protein
MEMGDKSSGDVDAICDVGGVGEWVVCGKRRTALPRKVRPTKHNAGEGERDPLRGRPTFSNKGARIIQIGATKRNLLFAGKSVEIQVPLLYSYYSRSR